jgi:hypothetical protein
LNEQQSATGQHFDTRVMSTEPASVLHRFVSLANEPDFLRLGWMREGVADVALRHLPARRAAFGRCVRRLVAFANPLRRWKRRP